MARIALAGGSGAVGKTILKALSQTSHEVIVLTRSAPQASPSANITYAQVSYELSDLTTFLTANKIDTVISAITMISPETSQAQLNLIAAAEASPITTRFIPSEYGVIASEEVSLVDPFGKFIRENSLALEATKTLKYTRIVAGMFLDFWGMSEGDGKGLDTDINPFKWVFDVENGKARIPGTGDEKLSLTYSRDVARYIARLLEEDDREWPKLAGVVGQDVTLNEVLGWLEGATRRKFDVSYDGMDVLEKGEGRVLNEGEGLEVYREIESLFGIMTVRGFLKIPDSEGFRLSERWTDLEVLTVEKMIREVWGRK